MIKDNIKIFFYSKILIQTKKNTILQVNSINNTKRIIKKFVKHIEKNKQIKLENS